MTSITLAEILTLCFSIVVTDAIAAYVVLTHKLVEETRLMREIKIELLSVGRTNFQDCDISGCRN